MSLFGQPAKPAGSLFGTSTTTTQPATGGLFGSSTAQQPAPGGLFGSSTAQQAAPSTGGLFGSTAAKPATGGLFGASTTNTQPQTNSLFGSTIQQPAQGGGLFGSTQPAAGGGLFGASAVQKPQEPSFRESFLAGSTAAPLPRLGQSQWMNQPGPREKPILTQLQELFHAWHPSSTASAFQTYFYQSVGADRAPYYGVPENEDPTKWEEALKNKPDEGSIPVLARGFGELGLAGRLRMQAMACSALYERVREIDASLGTRIEEHDLKFTVRTMEARRRHVALSRRCLALATKVQVLRNRGYALDGAEEELKKKLEELEKTTFDPVVGGRQEELWARMTVVRERARVLKEETERLGKKAGDADESQIDEETMAKIRQILTDYDSQLAHLRKELEMIKKEFENWAASEKPAAIKR